MTVKNTLRDHLIVNTRSTMASAMVIALIVRLIMGTVMAGGTTDIATPKVANSVVTNAMVVEIN